CERERSIPLPPHGYALRHCRISERPSLLAYSIGARGGSTTAHWWRNAARHPPPAPRDLCAGDCGYTGHGHPRRPVRWCCSSRNTKEVLTVPFSCLMV